MKEGLWTVGNCALVLKQWSVNFTFAKEEMVQVPVWVNLPDLDLHAWSSDALSKIASLIGVPLYADQCTSLKRRVSYARL